MRRVLLSFLLPFGVLAVMVVVILGIAQMLHAGGTNGSIVIGIAFTFLVSGVAWFLTSRTRPDSPVSSSH